MIADSAPVRSGLLPVVDLRGFPSLMAEYTGRNTARIIRRPVATYTRRLTADRYARPALAVIGFVMLCQILFLVFGCDWDLCNDEAEYWAWSRHLDWSYFSRGPLIAWLIRLATEMLGGMSVKLTGSPMLAVRFPAVLLGGLTAWGIFRLASVTVGNGRAALFAVLLLPAIPVLALGGVLITSDTPLVCCWAWAAVWTYRAISSRGHHAWIFTALIGILGVWAKYSFLAFPAGVGLFLLLSPTHRRHLRKPGFWAMSIACAGFGMAPIVIWNVSHGWAGANQLADRVGLSSRATWASVWPVLTFVAGDIVALGVVWWLVGVGALRDAWVILTGRGATTAPDSDLSQAGSASRSGLLYLVCLWGVVWAACFAASLLGETEVNWTVPGYVSLVCLIGFRVDQVFERGGVRPKLYALGWIISLAMIVALHHMEWFYPTIGGYLPEPTGRWPVPLRLYEPKARGGRESTRRVTVCSHSNLRTGINALVLPTRPARHLLPELEFRHDGQAGEPARPMAP
jgi:4-amino-4-deoxy-L-arabinose transferase-like glycosyltransferase